MAMLKELERDLAAAWAAELRLPDTAPDSEADRLQANTMKVLTKIAAERAGTIRDLRIKARAVMVCRGGDEDHGDHLEGRLIASLLSDLR